MIVQIHPDIFVCFEKTTTFGSKCEIRFTTGGAWREQPSDRGRMHLMEHCIVARTRDKGYAELKDWLQSRDISTNAYTSTMEMAITGFCHKSDFWDMVDVQLEMFFTPTFTDDILEREKEVVLKEIAQRRGSPQYQYYYDIAKQIYTPDSNNVFEVLGDADAVALTTVEDLQRLHTDNLTHSKIIVILSGNFTLNSILKKLKPYINNLKGNPEDKEPIEYSLPSQFITADHQKLVHQYGHEDISIDIRTPIPVTAQNKAVRSLFYHLYFNFNGPLYRRLRDDHQYVYSLSGSFSYLSQNMTISLSCPQDVVEGVISDVQDVIDDVAGSLVVDVFNDAKTNVAKRVELDKDSAGNKADFEAGHFVQFGEQLGYEEYIQMLHDVTFEDVVEYAQNIKLQYAQSKIILVSKDPTVLDIDIDNIF